jgi:hypothetical protein
MRGRVAVATYHDPRDLAASHARGTPGDSEAFAIIEHDVSHAKLEPEDELLCGRAVPRRSLRRHDEIVASSTTPWGAVQERCGRL